jgi:pimeloyl-ACP methyl ester carboxylesterase
MFFLSPAQLRPLLYFDPSAIPVPEMTPDFQRRQYKGLVTMARIAWNPYLHNPKLARRLARIDAPTLIVWGDHDGLIPPGYAEKFRGLIRNSRIAIIERCGHNILGERPKEFAGAVSAFLSEKGRAK